MPLGLEKCKELIEPVPDAAPKHPIADFDAGLGDDDNGAQGVALHNEPEFRSWLPDGQALDELLRKVGAGMTEEESQNVVESGRGAERRDQERDRSLFHARAPHEHRRPNARRSDQRAPARGRRQSA